MNNSTDRFVVTAKLAGGLFLLVLLGCVLVLLGTPCPLILPFLPPKEDAWPSWSSDSQRLVYECYLDGPREGGWTSIWDAGEDVSIRQSYYTAEAADLCISDLDSRKQERLKHPGGDWHPVWSPDGARIAYLRQDGIYLVTPEGQNRRRLVALNASTQLGWTPEQDIKLTWSPDGRLLLFSGCLDDTNPDVYVVDVDTSVMHNLTSHSRWSDLSPMWTLDGKRIVFYSSNEPPTSYCMVGYGGTNYQLKSMRADGSDERVIAERDSFYAFISVSNSGLISFAADNGIYVTDLTGRRVEVPIEDWVRLPVWSPDERYLAYHFAKLSVLNVRTGETLKSSQYISGVSSLVWSPDSQKIAVTASQGQEHHIYILDLDDTMLRPLAFGNLDKRD